MFRNDKPLSSIILVVLNGNLMLVFVLFDLSLMFTNTAIRITNLFKTTSQVNIKLLFYHMLNTPYVAEKEKVLRSL